MMFKLKTYKNQKINTESLVQILFYAFPLTFIIGNAVVSIHSIIFICLSFFLIKQKELNLRFDYLYWILIIFFSYLILNSFVQFKYPGLFWNTFIPTIELNNSINTDLSGDLDLSTDKNHWISQNNDPFLKSLIATRFLLLFIVIDILFYNKILNLKKIFLSSLICTTFVSLDILLQYITGKDLFGHKPFDGYSTGPFVDEKIATGYLKNFSFFSFFYIFKNIKDKNLNNILLILIIVIHLTAALVAGNRMPMILFLFGCGLIVLLVKNFRLIMSLAIIVFISIFFVITKKDTRIKNAYSTFLSTAILDVFKPNKELEKKGDKIRTVPEDQTFLRHSGHSRIMRSSIEIFRDGPWTGFGINSFRLKCFEILIKNNKIRENKSQKFSCSNHPHNYYLELLNEVGIVGIVFLITFFLVLLKKSLAHLKNFNKEGNVEVVLLLPVIIAFFLEVWPIRTSGSFFTTWNATFFWMCASIIMGYRNQKL